jgi:cation:H+ antiporter
VIVHLLLLVAGLLCIVKGGDLFVSSSVRIAEMLRMPRVVVGSTLVSLATTTPEMTVSVLAGLRGEPGLAIGNAVGSCVCNLLLILGTMAVVKELQIHASSLRVPFGVMVGFGVILTAFILDLRLSRWQGLLLVAGGVCYFVVDFSRHRTEGGRMAEDAKELETDFTNRHRWLRTGAGTAFLFGLGAILVVGGSRVLVEGAVGLATALGVPSIILGLTVIAVGTSLPELVTAVSSARRDVSDLAIGNLLGANIANLTLIAGSAAAIHEVGMSRATQVYNCSAMLGAMGLVVALALSGRRVTPREGWTLLGAYGLYLLGLVGLTWGPRW